MEHDERRELEALESIARELRELNELIEKFLFPRPTFFQITQINGGNMSVGTIKGIPVGGTGTLTETDVPSNAVDPKGSVRSWATSDGANTSITPSADNKSVSMAVSATAPVGGSTNLSFTDVFPDGTQATSGPVPVPYLPGVAPRPSDFRIDQTA